MPTALRHAPAAAYDAAEAAFARDLIGRLLALLDGEEPRRGLGLAAPGWAALIVRRSMARHHLWQDMGCASRDELNRFMRLFFPKLVADNRHNMRWKKFLYRALCQREGIYLCKSPNCETCEDLPPRFDGKPGWALRGGAAPVLGAAL